MPNAWFSSRALKMFEAMPAERLRFFERFVHDDPRPTLESHELAKPLLYFSFFTGNNRNIEGLKSWATTLECESSRDPQQHRVPPGLFRSLEPMQLSTP